MADAAVGTSTRALKVAIPRPAPSLSLFESAMPRAGAKKVKATLATSVSSSGAAADSVHLGASVVAASDLRGRTNGTEHPCARRAQATASAPLRRLRLP